MTTKQAISAILNHFITVAEYQTMEQQKTTALRASDYEGANAIFKEQQELQKQMLTLEQMKEMREALNQGSDE